MVVPFSNEIWISDVQRWFYKRQSCPGLTGSAGERGHRECSSQLLLLYLHPVGNLLLRVVVLPFHASACFNMLCVSI